jgi:uncharacterized membrane protein YczE
VLKQRFYRYLDVPLKQSFKQFRLGSMIFFAGLVVIFAASQLLHPSLAQELITLLGLLVVGLGFIIAILAQVRMLLARLVAFWRKPNQ